ncbi:MAG: c-type cytochrome [Bryobacterales bacterium]|nr:c-type cytochrome [Bryobacterales bacterium]
MRWLCVLLLCCPSLAPAQKNPLAKDPAAIENGRQTFLGACSACHGASAQGGTGPSLVSGRMNRLNDGQALKAIKNGLPGTDMPPFNIPDDKVWEMVTFLRSLSRPAIALPPAGSAEAGAAVFFGKGGCSNCHRIAGKGGAIGPDLTNAGANMTVLQMREAIFEPNARVAPGFEAVTVTTAAGAVIDGVARNENNYSLQVLDKAGKLHLLWRRDVKQFKRRDGSLMPAGYDQKLSKVEATDLLAFLSRQSIRPYEAGEDR